MEALYTLLRILFIYNNIIGDKSSTKKVKIRTSESLSHMYSVASQPYDPQIGAPLIDIEDANSVSSDIEIDDCQYSDENKMEEPVKSVISNGETSPNLFNTSVVSQAPFSNTDKTLSLKDFLLSVIPAHIDDENITDINSSSSNVSNNLTEGLYENKTNDNSNVTNSKKSFCVQLPFNETVFGDVQIVNSSTLQKLLVINTNVTSRSTSARCHLVYFFSNYCPFSAQGSAYVNALARSLNNIPIYGLNSIEDHSVNTRYGVMGTPSLILFHNGNVVAKYNASEYSTFFLESFVHYFTDQVIYSINVTSHDFKANLPSKVTPSTPYALYCAWLFLVMCGCCFFLNSEFYAKIKEAVLNNWREAEAQHAHDE